MAKRTQFHRFSTFHVDRSKKGAKHWNIGILGKTRNPKYWNSRMLEYWVKRKTWNGGRLGKIGGKKRLEEWDKRNGLCIVFLF
jgi:hypothetical protein